LQTNLDEKAIENAKSKKADLEVLQKTLKTMEREVAAGNSMSKAAEETFSIQEATAQLEKERSRYVEEYNDKTGETYVSLKNSIDLVQQEYDLQLNILDVRQRELAEVEKLATRNQDLATLESVRTDRNKARIASLNSEANLIKTIRSEQGRILMGSRGGRQALAEAEKTKARVDKKAAFRAEEEAVVARQQIEGGSKSRDVIRRMMAEEAVGLRVPKIQRSFLGTPSGAPSGAGGAGGFKTSITPTILPATSGSAIPPQASAGNSNDSINKLVSSVQSLVDRMKSGTMV
jgi:hypothetical protein